MSDRSTANLFGTIFDMLAKNPSDEHRAMAHAIYTFASDYDFNDYQMDSDESCFKLGIARKVSIDGKPDIYYFPSDEGFDDCEES